MGAKKIRKINAAKESARDSKKKAASDGVAKAKKKIDDGTKKRADRTAKRNDLKKRLETASDEEKVQINADIQKLDQDSVMEDAEISQAEQDMITYQQQEEEANAEDVTDEVMVDVDDNNGTNTEGSGASENKPANTEGSGPSWSTTSAKELVDGFLSGAGPRDDLFDHLDLSLGAGLLPTQRVVGFKSSGPYGQIAIVIDTEIPRCPIFRIRKNVVVPPGMINILDTRRAGKTNPETDLKWTPDDIDKVVGIAIAVPAGYGGEVENLVKPLPKLSLEQKVILTKAGKRIPRQPDVQLVIKWKKPIIIKVKGKSEPLEMFLSYENRGGCKTLWKKNYQETLDTAALKWEKHYREAGGKHQSEEREMSPFLILPVGSDFSRESTVDIEQLASTRTSPIPSTQPTSVVTSIETDSGQKPPSGQKPGSEQKPPSGQKPSSGQQPSSGQKPLSKKTARAAMKEAFAAFKENFLLPYDDIDDWEDLNVEQTAKGMAAWDAYWAEKSAASVI